MKAETKKVLEQITLAVELSNADESVKGAVKDYIQKIYYIESGDVKVGKLDLYKFCDSPKHGNIKMTGVYYDPEGYRVASDGHILAAIKSEFNADMNGKIIDKKGNNIEARYPNWTCVIPNDNNCYPVQIDFNEALDVCKQLAAMHKADTEDRDDFAIQIDEVRFNYKKFNLILTSMKEFGTDTIMLNSRPGGALKVSGNDGSVVILMPYYTDYNSNLDRTIALKKVTKTEKAA